MNQSNPVNSNTKGYSGAGSRSGDLTMLRRELKRTRIFCTVSSVLSACLLVCMAIIAIQIRPVIAYASQTNDKLEQLAQFTREAKPLLADLSQFTQDIHVGISQLSEVDTDALNAALESLEALDTEELSETLKNLNNVADALTNISDRFHSAFPIFGQ